MYKVLPILQTLNAPYGASITINTFAPFPCLYTARVVCLYYRYLINLQNIVQWDRKDLAV